MNRGHLTHLLIPEGKLCFPEIVRGIVPEFAPDFQRVSVREGSRLSAAGAVEARKFRARAARLVAANYTHRFAACDTSRFYPNATRNEV